MQWKKRSSGSCNLTGAVCVAATFFFSGGKTPTIQRETSHEVGDTSSEALPASVF
jgi:hypothetical protein